MSSLDNQIMVPTLTRFGRLAGLRGTASVTDAVATVDIITTPRRGCAADPPTSFDPFEETEGHGTVSGRGRGERRGAVLLRGMASGAARMLAMKVVVYSHDADTRAEMKLAIGA